MKALEKERSRRYESASQLAADIELHLECRPVLAGPPRATYRLKKYVRRHRLGVAAAGAMLLALAVGLIFAWDGYRDAEAARVREAAQRAVAEEKAEQAGIEAARSRAVHNLLDEMLSGGRPYSRGRNTTVATLIEEFEQKLTRGRQIEPEVEAFLRLSMVEVYLGLGELPQAVAQLERARQLAEQDGIDDPSLHRFLLVTEGYLENWRSNFRDAVALFRRALTFEAQPTNAEEVKLHCRLASALAHLGSDAEAPGGCRRGAGAFTAAGECDPLRRRDDPGNPSTSRVTTWPRPSVASATSSPCARSSGSGLFPGTTASSPKLCSCKDAWRRRRRRAALRSST